MGGVHVYQVWQVNIPFILSDFFIFTRTELKDEMELKYIKHLVMNSTNKRVLIQLLGSFCFTERLGFEVPTLVQAQAIPVILSGRHSYPFFFFFCLFCTLCYKFVVDVVFEF